MLIFKVTQEKIDQAKKQIAAFEKIEAGSWRYKNVFAWRGIVCEFLVAEWLEKNFRVDQKAKGLDDSGIVDDCDLMIKGKKVEIKSATKNYFRFIMPKVHDLNTKPKDVYIAAKYNETTEPNEVQLLGFLHKNEVLKYPIEQNMGAPYFKVPIADFRNVSALEF